MKKHYRQENDCLNCGTILEGHFCHNCGQENLQMKESFGHMITHAVSDYFHFDYQFFHTLKPLFGKPGKLTNEYLAGRRAQYLHPVKMYIFISLVFFVVFFQGKHDIVVVKNDKNNKQVADSVKKEVTKEIKGNANLSAEQKKILSEKIKKYTPDTIGSEVAADLEKDSVNIKDSQEGNFVVFGDDSIKTYEEYLAKQQKLPAAKRDNWLLRYLSKKNFDWKSHGKNSLEMFQEGFKHNVPKMMFLLLPLFALILKIAFWNNRKFYVEYIIYAIHLHCFIFLFLLAVMLINMVVPKPVADIMGLLATLVIIWYVYRSFRVVYNRSRWRTVSKMIGVGLMYLLVFSACFVLLAAITAITTV